MNRDEEDKHVPNGSNRGNEQVGIDRNIRTRPRSPNVLVETDTGITEHRRDSGLPSMPVAEVLLHD